MDGIGRDDNHLRRWPGALVQSNRIDESTAQTSIDRSALPSAVAKLLDTAREEEGLIDDLCRTVLQGEFKKAKEKARTLSKIRELDTSADGNALKPKDCSR